MDVGDGIEFKAESWNFDDAAENFDQHIARSVPDLQAQRLFVARLARFFLHEGALAYELGVSTGRLAQLVLEQVAGRSVRYVGIDNAPAMVEKARANLAGDPRFRAEVADAQALAFDPAALVLAYYTLQFIPAAARPDLLRRIHEALAPGGALVVYEKVLAADSRVQDLLAQLYVEFKADQGFTAEEMYNKTKALQGVSDPRTSHWNVAQLRRAGFSTVEVIFRNHCFEGYLAIKGSA